MSGDFFVLVKCQSTMSYESYSIVDDIFVENFSRQKPQKFKEQP